jgi:hypothetical protein
MLCKRTYKNQITIPKKVMEKFDGVEYFEASVLDGVIVLMPVEVKPLNGKSLERIRAKISGLGISADDITRAVAWSRNRKVRNLD